LLFPVLQVTAQNPYIKHYTTQNGLPSNTIYQIYQDSKKFLWFASDAGVTKFDGTNFTTYRKKDGLSSNDIVRIKEDPYGRLWFFSYNSSVNFIQNNIMYNTTNAPFLKYLEGKGFILDFYISSDQSINFYNWQREVFTLDKNNNIQKQELFTQNNTIVPKLDFELENIRVYQIYEKSLDERILWTSGGLYRFDSRLRKISLIDSHVLCKSVFAANEGRYYLITYDQGLLKVSSNFVKEKVNVPCDVNKIRTIIEDSEGQVWITAYEEGVYCMSGNQVIKHLDIKKALGLLEDHEKNIWVSSDDGIYVINHDFLSERHYEKSMFGGTGINSLHFSVGSGLWFSTNNSAILYKYSNFYTFPLPGNLQPAKQIFTLSDNTLVISSNANSKIGLFRHPHFRISEKKIEFVSEKVYDIFIKRIINNKSGKLVCLFMQEYLTIGPSSADLFFRAMVNTGERINNVYFDNNDGLIVNSKRNYVFKNNKLEPYPLLSRFDGSVLLSHLFIDERTELLNIDGDSLFLLQNNRLYNLSKAFTAPVSMQIRRCAYADSTLFIATLSEIYKCNDLFRVTKGETVHLEPLNISFNNINDILVYNDSLYIASDEGLTVISSRSVTEPAIPPIPFLQSIRVNDIPVTVDNEGLRLRGSNNIHLMFGSISYFSASVIYSYKLEGADTGWTIATGNGLNLNYQRLPQGKYQLKVRARKYNSGWSEPLTIPIEIKQTLLKMPAFWAFIALLAASLVLLIVNRSRLQRMKKIEVDHQLVLMEQKALQSMMNPHFIFNSLGSIQTYLLKNKGTDAAIYLAKFARLIRKNLDVIDTPMILLDEEIDRLENYLELEKERMGDKFEYSVQFDESLNDFGIYIPSMIIQPFVENSIWHGLANLDGNGFVHIIFKPFSNNSLCLVIEDNGIGIEKAKQLNETRIKKQHLGVQIIQKRLQLLSKKYNTTTSIDFSELTPGTANPGTRVTIVMPFLTNSSDI